jgi:uncharacterized membrane protein YdjX (TVP38/TMEM64 family)
MNQRYWAIAILVILIAAILISPAFFNDTFGGWLDSFETFATANPVLAPVAFIALAAASVLLGPFTSAPTIPFAVAAWGDMGALLFLLFGWLLGGVGAYALGRWVGEPLVARVIGREQLADWLSKISSRLDFITLLLFRLAMPAETGYLFGLLRYRFSFYLLITFLAEIPFALVLVYGSVALISSSATLIAIGAIVWIAIVALALRLFMRRVR